MLKSFIAVLICFLISSCVSTYDSSRSQSNIPKENEKVVFGGIKVLYPDMRKSDSQQTVPMILDNMVLKSTDRIGGKYVIKLSSERNKEDFQGFSLPLPPGSYTLSQARILSKDYLIKGLSFNIGEAGKSVYIGDISIFIDSANRKFTLNVHDNAVLYGEKFAAGMSNIKSLAIANNPSINSEQHMICRYGNCFEGGTPTLNLPW